MTKVVTLVVLVAFSLQLTEAKPRKPKKEKTEALPVLSKPVPNTTRMSEGEWIAERRKAKG